MQKGVQATELWPPSEIKRIPLLTGQVRALVPGSTNTGLAAPWDIIWKIRSLDKLDIRSHNDLELTQAGLR